MKHTDLMRSMIRKAVEKHEDGITPTVHKESFWDCFTIERGDLVFWYNDLVGNTKVVVAKADREAN